VKRLLAIALALIVAATMVSATEIGGYTTASALNGTERIPADQTSGSYPCSNCTVNITPALINTYVKSQNVYGSTQFTTSGSCTVGSKTGGPRAGTVQLGAAGGCTLTITINGATGYTASVGFNCWGGDRTQPTIPAWIESSSTTTTVTMSIPAAASNGDVIGFHCEDMSR